MTDLDGLYRDLQEHGTLYVWPGEVPALRRRAKRDGLVLVSARKRPPGSRYPPPNAQVWLTIDGINIWQKPW